MTAHGEKPSNSESHTPCLSVCLSAVPGLAFLARDYGYENVVHAQINGPADITEAELP